MTRKFANAVAAIFWFIITAIRIADLSPIGLFAAALSGALVALLIVRAAPTRESPAHVKALASMATLVPFAMMPTSGGQIWIGMPMQLLGLVVAVWSMVALGRSSALLRQTGGSSLTAVRTVGCAIQCTLAKSSPSPVICAAIRASQICSCLRQLPEHAFFARSPKKRGSPVTPVTPHPSDGECCPESGKGRLIMPMIQL